MLTILLEERGGKQKTVTTDSDDVTIGRVAGNDVVLPRKNISKHHCRIMKRDGLLMIVDLDSTNGTYVNGMRLETALALQPDDVIRVGDFHLTVQSVLAEQTTPAQLDDEVAEIPLDPIVSPTAEADGRPELIRAPARTGDDSAWRAQREAIATLHQAVRNWLADFGDDATVAGPDEKAARVRLGLGECLRHLDDELPGWMDRTILSAAVERELTGLGAFDVLIADPVVDEITVNGPADIVVLRDGKRILTDHSFSSAEALMTALGRMVPGGRIDGPITDVRLSDRSRLTVFSSSVAPLGPVVHWMRARAREYSLDALVQSGALSRAMARFLRVCTEHRRNIVVTGPSGAGKTALMGALGATFQDWERIVVVEEAAEMLLAQPQAIRLESVPPISSQPAVPLDTLLQGALRTRPQRVILGDARGAEVLTMLQAMGAGQTGTVMGVHSTSVEDCIERMEMMARLCHHELNPRALKQLLGKALDVVVEVVPLEDGGHRVSRIAEVGTVEVDVLPTTDIFRFAQRDDGEGAFQATGVVPRFYDELKRRDVRLDLGVFREG